MHRVGQQQREDTTGRAGRGTGSRLHHERSDEGMKQKCGWSGLTHEGQGYNTGEAARVCKASEASGGWRVGRSGNRGMVGCYKCTHGRWGYVPKSLPEINPGDPGEHAARQRHPASHQQARVGWEWRPRALVQLPKQAARLRPAGLPSAGIPRPQQGRRATVVCIHSSSEKCIHRSSSKCIVSPHTGQVGLRSSHS